MRTPVETEGFPFPTTIVAEGKVRILVPRATIERPSFRGPSSKRFPAFYNPGMALNRDLSVLALRAHKKLKLLGREAIACDAMAGCGAKGLRLASEVEGTRILLNDINPTAVRLINYNVRLNALEERALVRNEDARLLLLERAFREGSLDYVDLDPFGSPAIFIEAALCSLTDGGLLALTATDAAVLNGVHPKACIRKYWARPLRSEYQHEVGARILLGYTARVAAMHGLGISPLLTERSSHYIRSVVLVKRSSKAVKEAMEAIGFLYHCQRCFHRYLETYEDSWDHMQLPCSCGSKLLRAGPLWIGRLSNRAFLEAMLQESEKATLQEPKAARRLLGLLVGEAEAPPTYFVPHRMCKELGISIPSLEEIAQGLQSIGYSFFPTHFSPGSFKTDAPAKVLVDILRKARFQHHFS
jgi:tRNA (guanine26-N2/guanine27-N2)-dimethyltransferase